MNMESIDTEKSWFAVMYYGHKVTFLINNQQQSNNQIQSNFLAYYKFSKNY